MRCLISALFIPVVALLLLTGCSDTSQNGTFVQLEGDVTNVSLTTFCTNDEIVQETFDTLPSSVDLQCEPAAVQCIGRGTDLGMRLVIEGENVGEDRETLELDDDEDRTEILEIFLFAPGVTSQEAQRIEELREQLN